MSKRCKGDHHHVKTEGGVIKSAAIYSKRLVAATLGGLPKTLRGFKKSHSLLKKDNSVPNRRLYRCQKAAMTILGLSDVATEKEIGEEIKGHES